MGVRDKDRDERFKKLWDKNLSHEAIAARLGLSKASIVSIRDRLGLKARAVDTNGVAPWR